ncbi:hypothetical protein EWB00_000699 [Schistosoma japonicum]|uniref:Uncharacterized protein n=1 Tax=Schistosoma japonicum TaxID=6182 RepID=A0A4Z2CKC5_SCHJA|nr:hypothetical protein EWB00_000699 [Schistosoma japonicum]
MDSQMDDGTACLTKHCPLLEVDSLMFGVMTHSSGISVGLLCFGYNPTTSEMAEEEVRAFLGMDRHHMGPLCNANALLPPCASRRP